MWIVLPGTCQESFTKIKYQGVTGFFVPEADMTAIAITIRSGERYKDLYNISESQLILCDSMNFALNSAFVLKSEEFELCDSISDQAIELILKQINDLLKKDKKLKKIKKQRLYLSGGIIIETVLLILLL